MLSTSEFTIEEVSNTKHKYSETYIKICPTKCPETPLGLNLKLNPMFMTKYFATHAKEIHDFVVYEDDIWVISFPKCGTTWTQEMVWMIGNNLDFETGGNTMLVDRFPFIELSCLGGTAYSGSTIQQARDTQRPRFIKSHLPVAMLPKQLWTVKPKIIYVTRNPKDAAISYFHHSRSLEKFDGTMEDFFEHYLNNMVKYAPFHSHVLEFWQMRDQSNISFHTYEQMKEDLPAVIQRISKFLLGKPLTENDVQRLTEHLSLDAMRQNETVNMEKRFDEYFKISNLDPERRQFKFIRNGQCGQFRSVMSYEWIEKFNKWSEAELKNTDFNFNL